MISILCGVYKAEHTIGKLIESILRQTYEDYEAIFCVNGIQDASKAILEKYSKQDRRIRIICFDDQLGAGGAREKAYMEAKGEYIAVVDNDDLLDPNYLSDFDNAIKKFNQPDIVISGFKRVENNKVKYIRRFKNVESSIYQSVAPWGKIYKSSFLKDNGICFHNVPFGEDIVFTIEVLLSKPKAVYIPACGYNWINNLTSASHTEIRNFPAGNLDVVHEIFSDFVKRYGAKSEQIKYLFYKYYIWYFLQSGRSVGWNKMRDEYSKGIVSMDRLFGQWEKETLRFLVTLKYERGLVKVVLMMALFFRFIKLDRFIFPLYAILPLEKLWPSL